MSNEKYIVCIDLGYGQWSLDVFDTEEEAVECTQATSYGSDFRVFFGKELAGSFKEIAE